MKIAITGGSGFVGSKLAKLLVRDGHQILSLDHAAPKKQIEQVHYIKTDLIHDLPIEEYLSCDAVIHLAGVNIFGRWTPAYKKLIVSSRVETAKALIQAVKNAGKGPGVFVSASAVGYYGDGGEEVLLEGSPNGRDFLAQVCKEWEQVAAASQNAGMRWVSIRTGIVLGPGGGMLAKLLPIFRWGLGGSIGNGKQWFSWIFMDDLLRVYKTVTLDPSFSGPVNAVSPHPVRNKELTKALGRVLHRPAFFLIPNFLLKLVMGELGSVITMSQKVVPEILVAHHFEFLTPSIDQALQESVC